MIYEDAITVRKRQLAGQPVDKDELATANRTIAHQRSMYSAFGMGRPESTPPARILDELDEPGLRVFRTDDTATLMATATEAATKAERERIFAVLEMCRPTATVYSRRDWAIEEKGAQAMFDKLCKALGMEQKGGE